MMYYLTQWWKLLLALSFLALDGMADDLSGLIDNAQAQGNQIISSGWTLDEEGSSSSTNEPRLQQQASDLPPPPPPPFINYDSLLLLSAGGDNDCADELQSRPAPGKLKKRLRFSKRSEQQQQLSCPVQEFRNPGARADPIPPPPPLAGGSTSQFDPNRQKRPTTMRKIINEKLLRPITDVSVCGFQEGLEIPICAPYFVTAPDTTISLLRPCRFWRLEDVCEDLIEDLWCCKSAYVDKSSPEWRLNVMTKRYFSTAEVCRRLRDAQIRN